MRLNVEMRMVMGVVNVEMMVELVMLILVMEIYSHNKKL